MNTNDLHKYKSGIAGNCTFIAHIGVDSNISWMCRPYFDSPYVFGSMLDGEPKIQIVCDIKHGYGEYTGKKTQVSNHISFHGTGFDTSSQPTFRFPYILSNRHHPFFYFAINYGQNREARLIKGHRDEIVENNIVIPNTFQLT